MSVISLFSQSSFDPEMTDVLIAAFEAAWQRIQNSGNLTEATSASRAATREVLAKNIIAVARSGECDKDRLVEASLARLAIDPEGLLFAAKDGPSE